MAALKHEPYEIEQRFGQGRGAALIRAIGDGHDLVRGVIARHRIKCAARRSGILTTVHSRNTQTTTAEALTFAATRSLTIEITTAYCRQLADLYRRFVLPPAGWGADLEATFALEACRKGNPEGIPILEKKLRDNRVSIPGKEFKP